MQMRGFKAAVLVPGQRQEGLIRLRLAWAAGRRAPPTGGRSVGSGKRAREEPGHCQAPSAPSPQRGCTVTGLETHPGRRSAVLGTQHFLELSFLSGRHLGAQRCCRKSAQSGFFNEDGV